MTSNEQPCISTKTILFLLITTYYFVIALFYIGSLVPELRVWGFNWWAYHSDLHKYGILLIGAAAGPILYILNAKSHPSDTGCPEKLSVIYIILFLFTIVAMITAFILFRATTHFLGDGYQLLVRLANQEHSAKMWDVGATIVQFALFDLFSGHPEEKALLTFQVWSIVSGAGFVIGTMLLARSLFECNRDRFLFFLGLVLGGYTLMFFGYVENYAMLTMAILIYTLTGLRVAQRQVAVCWLIPPMLLAVFLHLFGLLLAPSFLYLLLRDSKAGKWLGGLPAKTKLLIIFLTVVVAGILYYLLYANYYFFKFMLLPPFHDHFTVDNDMLFSLKHVVDILNLLVLMVPGVPLYVLLLALVPSFRIAFRKPEYRFLLIVLVFPLAAVYVINPGIGMPRNWDLFSVVGVPLAVLCFYSVIKLGRGIGVSRVTALFMTVLGFLSLAPRVAVQVLPELALTHFNNYISLDKTRNKNAYGLLVEYYEKQGNMEAARKERVRKIKNYPEVVFNDRAREHVSHGEFSQAVPYARRAIELNPLFWDAYANLGASYRHLGKLDSALTLMKITDGLNPYNAEIVCELGAIYMMQGELYQSERMFLKSLRLDSAAYGAMFGLVSVAMALNQIEKSFEYVTMLYRHGQQDSTYFRRAGDTYLNQKAFDEASKAYSYALDRGLDSTYVRNLKERFPRLNR